MTKENCVKIGCSFCVLYFPVCKTLSKKYYLGWDGRRVYSEEQEASTSSTHVCKISF